MGLILSNTALEIVLGSVLLLFWSFYFYITKDYDFWAKRGVPYKRPVFPFGSLKEFVLGKLHMGNAYAEIYREFPDQRFCGAVELNRPVLIVRDPELIKHILIKDFNYFIDRALADFNPKESINKHLFGMNKGDGWRDMRHKLSPAFTSGKMKQMFLFMVTCSKQLEDCLEKMTKIQTTIDVKEVLAKFTIDIIASCAFGVETNSLTGNTEFYEMGISIFKPTLWMVIKQRLITVVPLLAEILNIERVAKTPKKLLHDLVSNTVTYREKYNISKNDFLGLLIKIRQNKSILDEEEDKHELKSSLNSRKEEGLTIQQMTAQAFIFFVAGFETASSTMTFCLYELAQHPDIQNRLWQEVEDVLQRYDGQVTYQALQEMKYMDQVINETLRMYASLGVLHRRCTQTYKIPGSNLTLEPGLKIRIPIYALHHDPQYYPEPYKFDPERFTIDQIKARHSCLHLPFGDGPRNCIGMRFGLMQTKIGLTTIISRFRVEVAPETPTPIQLLPTSVVTQSNKPVFLKMIPR